MYLDDLSNKPGFKNKQRPMSCFVLTYYGTSMALTKRTSPPQASSVRVAHKHFAWDLDETQKREVERHNHIFRKMKGTI